jgi:hypothetical protein
LPLGREWRSRRFAAARLRLAPLQVGAQRQGLAMATIEV